MNRNDQVKISESASKQVCQAGYRNRLRIRNAAMSSISCLVTSILLTIALRHTREADSAPLLFLLVVGVIANRFGTTGGILGLLAGTYVFANFLYPPYRSLLIAGETARTNVVMMLLFGMAIAYFYGAEGPGKHQDDSDETSRRSNTVSTQDPSGSRKA